MDLTQKMVDHLKLVMEENQKTNLTAIRSEEEGLVLHVEDSLNGLFDINEAPSGLYGDMGTGAGFPGIPLALASGRKTLLIDSVGKKTDALQRMVQKLEIKDKVSVFNGRLEELAQSKKEEFSVLTARALTQLPSLIELASPLLVLNGRLVCYKSQLPDQELERARSVEEKLGMKFLYKREYQLENFEGKRCIVVFKKKATSQIVLPRRIGMAQKRPLA